MLMLKKLLKILIILSFPFNAVSAADIPIIVIAPSKKAQSVSTVGTSVTVLDESFFENSKDFYMINNFCHISQPGIFACSIRDQA